MKTHSILQLKTGLLLMVTISVIIISCKRTQLGEIDPLSERAKDVVASHSAMVYYVADSAQLASLTLQPGDNVILTDGDWSNVHLRFKGTGTALNPITFSAATLGEVIFKGKSTIEIEGQWLVLKGLLFTDGYSVNQKDVIKFSSTSNNCRLTNCSIINYNHPTGGVDYKWVTVNGENHRIDHCEFTGKADTGATIVVNNGLNPNYHQIDFNYFGPRPVLGVNANGGETIRIGNSTSSTLASYTTVKHNIFYKCDGEGETVSVKSGYNTIRDNLFYETAGTITLRQGENNIVNSNYFIGKGKSHTGGIRITGANQTVRYNYFEGLKGTNSRAAISLRNAEVAPSSSGYWQVKNANIESNILVNCYHNFVLGEKMSASYPVAPDSVKLANNYIIDPTFLIIYTDTPTNLNIYNNQTNATLTTGFIAMGNDLEESDGIWQRSSNLKTPFWLTLAVGTTWGTSLPEFSL